MSEKTLLERREERIAQNHERLVALGLEECVIPEKKEEEKVPKQQKRKIVEKQEPSRRSERITERRIKKRNMLANYMSIKKKNNLTQKQLQKIETCLRVDSLGMNEEKHGKKHDGEEETTKLTQVRIPKMARQNDKKIGMHWKRTHCFYWPLCHKNVNECQGWSSGECIDFDKYMHISEEELNNRKREARNEVKRERARAKVIATGRQVRTYNREQSNESKRRNALKMMSEDNSL